MSEPERKSFSVEIKDAEKGIVTAVISKFNVIDHDHDLTLPGAFGEQKVAVSSYGHNSWMGTLPVGRGAVKEKEDEAIAELKFFMSTQHGKEHFDVIKEMGEPDFHPHPARGLNLQAEAAAGGCRQREEALAVRTARRQRLTRGGTF